jgi:glycerate kinase
VDADELVNVADLIDSTKGRVLVCPDKFRGSATALQAAEALAAGLRSGGRGDVRILPVADGGEGTIDCCLAAGFTPHRVEVTAADGQPVTARFATRAGLGVIEAAQACGFGARPPSRSRALQATTYGVGELIRAALERGYRDLVVGVGGTATTDGGAGMLQALGAQLLDGDGRQLGRGGGNLLQLRHLDLSGLDPRLSQAHVAVATDVDNPLLGPRGATSVFAAQKGADPADIDQLERGLQTLTELFNALTAGRLEQHPGAGAGGGLGYALLSAAHAHRVSGADTVLDLLDFDRQARAAALVVTGEGSLDASSLAGKAPTTLARRAHRLGARVIAVAGRSTLTSDQRRTAGIDKIYQLTDLADSIETSMTQAAHLLERVGERIARSTIDPDADIDTAGIGPGRCRQ